MGGGDWDRVTRAQGDVGKGWIPSLFWLGVLVSRVITCVKIYQIICSKMYSILYANYTSEKFKKIWVGNSNCFLEKLVTFLLESLLFLAKSETGFCGALLTSAERQWVFQDKWSVHLWVCRAEAEEIYLFHCNCAINNQQSEHLLSTRLSIVCTNIILFNAHTNLRGDVTGPILQKRKPSLREIPNFLRSGRQIQDLKQVFIYFYVLFKLSTMNMYYY